MTNDKIYEGQQLKIIKTSNSATNNYHIVQSGESIWSIAQKYNVSEQNIMKWNNLKNDKIYPGQKLIIYQNQQNTSISKSTFAKSNKITYIVKNGEKIVFLSFLYFPCLWIFCQIKSKCFHSFFLPKSCIIVLLSF